MKKILFIKLGSFSHVNKKVADTLKDVYPNNEVVVYDVLQDVFSSKITFVLNLFYFIWEYKADILFRYKNLKELKSCLIVTTFFYEKVRKKIEKKYADDDILFTIQTSSQVDCSMSSVPHVVYTDHTLRANFLYPDLDYWVYQKPRNYTLHLEKRIYENAQLILTYSNFVKSSLVNQYEINPKKIEVLGITPNTNVSTVFPQDARDEKTILFVGVDWKRKGGALLVDAFNKVVLEVPEARLQIVGSSPDNIQHPQIEIIGKISLSEVDQYYQKAAIFCMPTLREPFGVVFLEAMSYSLPIVALDRGAVKELVKNGENGFLSRGNATELAEYLIKLLKDPQLARHLGENGAAFYRDNYNTNKFRDKLYSSVNQILPEDDTVDATASEKKKLS